MRIPIVIERVSDNGFRARAGEPFALAADGATKDEARHNLQQLIEERVISGAEYTTVEIPGVNEEHPLAKYSGMFKDNPLMDEWRQAVAEYRRQVDEDPDVL